MQHQNLKIYKIINGDKQILIGQYKVIKMIIFVKNNKNNKTNHKVLVIIKVFII